MNESEKLLQGSENPSAGRQEKDPPQLDSSASGHQEASVRTSAIQMDGDAGKFGCMKAIEEMKKEAFKIEPYSGSEDHRSPAQYIKEFEKVVCTYVECEFRRGAIFRHLLCQSKWCRKWATLQDKNISYTQIVKRFTEREWPPQKQYEIFMEFSATNAANQFDNYEDFYNYWKNKLEGVGVDKAVVLNKFLRNLPKHLQGIFKGRVDSLEQLDEKIRETSFQLLKW